VAAAAETTKEHGDELVPATEAAGVMLAVVAADNLPAFASKVLRKPLAVKRWACPPT